MSRSVHERLRDLEAEVHGLQVLPAAAVRARGNSRTRRRLATVTVAGAVAAITLSSTFEWPHQRTEPPGGQPALSPALRCELTLPDSPAQVQIRILDGGAPAGVPATAASQLRAREFTVLGEATSQDPVGGGAALRYGPAAVGAATLLRAVLPDETIVRFDPDRRDATIDLTIGPSFTRLATTTELNQNLVTLGKPSAPPQCVAVSTPGR